MARQELSSEALAHVVAIPEYLKVSRFSSSIKIQKLAQTLKLMSRDQALSYDKAEFERDYGVVKKIGVKVQTACKPLGLRARVVEDQGKVYVFANEFLVKGSARKGR